MKRRGSQQSKLVAEQERVIRAHWEWAGGWALLWISALS